MKKRITKGQEAQVSTQVTDIHILFDKSDKKLAIKKMSPWQHVFTSKNHDLTSHHYLLDPDLFAKNDRTNPGRKLLGRDETLTIGSIRNQLYLGNKSDITFLEPEHLRIRKDATAILFENLSSKPITLIYESPQKK